MAQSLKDEAKTPAIVFIIAAIAATGGLLFGFDTGVISGALLFIRDQWALTASQQGFLVSSVVLGAAAGAIFSGVVADKYGRKKVIIVTAILFFLGSIWTAIANNYEILVAGRFLIGIAIGIASFSVPLYISEIAPNHIRGALVSLNQLAITIGILASYGIDHYFAVFEDGWRFMFLVGVVPSAILCIGMFFMPNSPRWLILKGYDEQAKKVIAKINPKADANKELCTIKETLNTDKKADYKDLFQKWLKPALIIGIGMMFIQQMTGINTVIYYAPSIFEMAGFVSKSAAISASVAVGVVNVVFTIISLKLIDKIGRRPLLLGGLTGMMLGLIALGLAFTNAFAMGQHLQVFVLISLLTYIASFAISLGPVCWLIISEVYPLKVRGFAMSLSTMANWLFNFVVALTFLMMIDFLGKSGTFWLYAGICLLGWFFCYYYVPETKGRSLEEIEQHWLDEKHPREL